MGFSAHFFIFRQPENEKRFEGINYLTYFVSLFCEKFRTTSFAVVSANEHCQHTVVCGIFCFGVAIAFSFLLKNIRHHSLYLKLSFTLPEKLRTEKIKEIR